MDVPKNRGTPKWMVYNAKTPNHLIWGYSLETSIWIHNNLFDFPVKVQDPENAKRRDGKLPGHVNLELPHGRGP